jgi:hypothetical protein
MIYTFETMDGEKFVIDISKARWGRASSILATPSIAASEHAIARYVYSEEGELTAMGGGAYNLEGRMPLPKKPTEEQLKAPGAGLSSVGLLTVLFEGDLIVYLKANVQVKDGSFSSEYLREFPEARQKTVKHIILQEPPKPEENKAIVTEE